MSAPARRFCREESLRAGEGLAGTGEHPGRMLLIRWPKGSWTRDFDAAADMTAAERAAVAGVSEGGRRVQLVDRKGEPEGEHRLWLYPEMLTLGVARAGLAPALAGLAAGDLSEWKPAGRRLLLVCTHGQKDRCCARWGFAAYKAFTAKAPEELEVLESTHLGGCRLAASTLGLPAMTKHGRIAPEDAGELLEAEGKGVPLPRQWRGPCHMSPAAQAQVVFRRLGRSGPPAVRQVRRPATCAELDAGNTSTGCDHHVLASGMNDP
ncbi:sucrase ferredoxin [Limimaricola sp.]|uniref:sucrase ferredoxin n=1 Tax=Limimaricola sp. TaxID=2211665 RepID=UPI004059B94F